ncbi:tRNA (guanosine(46)-N7)-methyltransferase TrmB [Aliterella atlantica]|uniref:tRNA (guanine-N(7)-)-methyltransferase n=1 Tax=Aliterella atlantica CENA595 TaxID=1618023 RepID=A0A0D8ZR75_9CYAN|nr:tRNA (guanosine(46)-N7)-methyltransferase TrmB [Aliterella atlantica]KJH71308.1 tRNA (guanine-N7)-methyltransferase [Aliterella atlantica CENA595]
MSPVRVRQHVNPLAIKYIKPIAPLDWEKIYAQPHQPLHLDIGCARGQFLMSMASLTPEWNFLGLEIREPLVEEAIAITNKLNLTNLHFLFCNVNNSLAPLLKSLLPGTLQRVTIQFPDPWFKNRHAKRRLVQPQLVAELATYLSPGSMVFLQSDIEPLLVEMSDRFVQHPDFICQSQDPLLTPNPLPVQTEREQTTLARGEAVYRAVFTRR